MQGNIHMPDKSRCIHKQFVRYRISSVMSVSFQNNPKNPDLSHKMNLDLWDCLGKVKLIL